MEELVHTPHVKSNFFKDVNPEITYVTVFEAKYSKDDGKEGLVDLPNTDLEIIQKEITRSMKESSKRFFSRPKALGPCFSVNQLYNPRGIRQVCELCARNATLCCAKCTVTYYCCWEHWKRDRIHSTLCDKIKMIRWPLGYKSNALERRRSRAQKLLVMEMLLDDLVHEAYLCIAQKRYHQAMGALLQCFQYVLPVYGRRDSGSQTVTLYTALTETYIGLNDDKLAKKMMISALSASFQEKDRNRTEKQMTFLNAQLQRTQGLLQVSEGDYAGSIYSFSEYIIYLSEAVGPSHIRVAMGYFFLGRSFLSFNKVCKGRCLITFCVDRWLYFIVRCISTTISDFPKLPPSRYFSVDKSNTMTRLIKQDSIRFFSDIWEFVDEEDQPLDCLKLYLCQIMMLFMDKKYKPAGELLIKSARLLNGPVDDEKLHSIWKLLSRIYGRKTKASGSHQFPNNY